MQKYNVTKSLGGLNQDDEVRFIPAGDYIYAENLRTAITEGGRMGTQTNVRGNWLITQYNCPYTDVFPQGKNKTLGYCEDIKNNSIIFFNWNSNNEHGIYRFWRDRTDANNPYGVCDQIVSYDFGWSENERITSASIVYGETGDLLYWTDSVMPRKINLTKGNLVDKKKSWDLFLPVTCDFPNLITFTFKNKAGGTIKTVIVGLSEPTVRNVIIDDITSYINGLNNVPVIAVSCDCSLQFVEKVSGEVWTVEVDFGAIMIVPDNWYGSVLIERFFDRCKYPFLEPPLMEFAIDSSYDPNYVKNKVFQSRLQPFYDDNEGSSLTLGVWSQIPINNLGCDGTSSPQYNYIDIDFNDSSIANPQTLVLLKKINLIMREHNTGADRKIILLEPCDFLDYDYTPNAEKWVVHYKFYNDIISSAIDSATAAKLFDDVPLKSDAELYVKNKIVEGGILEGYNAPDCIDAKPQMEFGDTPNPKLHKVKFRIRILTFGLSDAQVPMPLPPLDVQTFYEAFPTLRKYPFWQPYYTIVRGGIFHDVSRTTNNFAFFGGGGFGTGAGGDFGIRAGMESEFDQRCPEGGFPVYAAGTPYFAISKQLNIGLGTDSSGALDTSTPEKISQIGDYLYGTANNGGDLYSEVEILVPEGEYVFRVASHWCSFGDKLAKGFAYDLSSGTTYQKTSTNVWGVVPAGKDPLDEFLPQKEIKIIVNSDISHAGTFIIMDLAPPYNVSIPPSDANTYFGKPLNFYLYDSLGVTDINSNQFDGIPVEKAIVTFSAFHDYLVGWQETAVTDHNGYYFGISSGGALTQKAYQVNNQILVDSALIGVGSLSDLFNKTCQLTNYAQQGFIFGGELLSGIVPTSLSTGRANASTYINGKVVDSATPPNPIQSVLVVYENGRNDTTAIDGSYSFVAWGDMITPNLPNFPNSPLLNITEGTNRVVDNLIFELPTSCLPSYPNGQEYSPVNIDPFGTAVGEYNPTNPYLIPNFIIDEGNNPSIKAHKRGGNYTYGLRLYDNAGRLCSVVKAFEMYVPFITEDIGKYQIENFSGVVYPTGTYKYGKPSIKWVLSPNTVFPTWATTFQWMRVKNSIYGRYLQWVANQVTYLSATATATTPEIQTSFQNADAVAIKISLSNITSYYAANNNSQVGYTYQAGDRVRLIANRSLVNYQGVNDFEVTSYDSTTQSIIIKPNGFPFEIQSGTLFEIFNPKSVETTDEQIYYEVGEVVSINNGIPAKYNGVFTNGDTYWRGRLIIVNDDATKFASAYPVVIEDASISDFYVSQDQDIGRIGIIDPNFKQIYNPAKLRVSNDYQVSSANNGLSSFEELNQKELDKSYGEIKRLFFVNNNLVVVTQNKEVSNYIGIITIQQASKGAEAGILSTTDQFFGTDYYHSKLLGADFAGSVVFNNNSQLMGYNSRLANVWQYEQNGEQVISDVKMINYFKGLAGKVTDCVGIYDRNYEEYILTIWRDGVPETLAWCEAKKRWTTFYSFTPECYASLGSEIYSFNQGALYIHDKNPTRNLFYVFQQGVSKLNVVFNSEPDLYKNWQMCILKTLQDNYANDWEVPMIYNDNKQQSRLVKGSWTKRGEDWFASFKRNLLNPTVANPILNAEPLRSSTLTCELVNAYTGDMRIYSWDSGYNYSERTLPK